MGFTTTRVVDEEKIKIPPEDLIESALYHQSRDEYDIAEKEFITAIRNSKGAVNEKSIVSNVKTRIITLYTLWANYSANNNDFNNAEYILKKQEKIYSNKELFRNLYEVWGDVLASEGNILGAENRYLKALIYELKIGHLDFDSPVIKRIKYAKLLSNSAKDHRIATQLYIIQNEHSFFIRHIVLFIIGLLYLLISSVLSYYTLQSMLGSSFSPCGFEILTIILALSPAVILYGSPIKYEKKYYRGKRHIVFHWGFCVINILSGAIAYIFNIDLLFIFSYCLVIAFSFVCIFKSIIMLCLYIKTKKEKCKKRIINDLIKNKVPDEKVNLNVEASSSLVN